MSRTQDEIRAALDSGEAFLRYIVVDEAFYGPVNIAHRDPHISVEFDVGITMVEGGTPGEWMVEHVKGIGMRHRIFDDAPNAFAIAVERGYLRAMAAHTPAEFRAVLDELGFVDKTQRRAPVRREVSDLDSFGREASR